MGIFIFNDLSINKFYDDFESFKKALKELSSFYRIGKNQGYKIYIYKNYLTGIVICNIPFCKAINDTKYINIDERRLILGIFDKSSPVLPDDSAIPENFMFFYNEKDVSNTGLAECAFQQMMGEIVFVYSLSDSDFRLDSLDISIIHNNNCYNEKIKNYFSLAVFEKKASINSWDDFIDYIDAHFESIVLIDSAKKILKRETFETNLADAIIKRVDVLNKMVNAGSMEEFHEMHRNYCEGEGRSVWFSDESDTRKNELKNKLTFKINGENKLCSYHGKVQRRDFRMHMSSPPERGGKIYIAYIGGKIL